MRIGAIIVLIWLLIGGFAAYQRDYFKDDTPDCKKVATIALNVVAGPLNYVGLDPKVGDCDVPEPSE